MVEKSPNVSLSSCHSSFLLPQCQDVIAQQSFSQVLGAATSRTSEILKSYPPSLSLLSFPFTYWALEISISRNSNRTYCGVAADPTLTTRYALHLERRYDVNGSIPDSVTEFGLMRCNADTVH